MKIICVGMNYLKHIEELGLEQPIEPVFFLKPDTSLLQNDAPFYIPDFSNRVNYECELVVKVNRIGKSISERYASDYYSEISLGLDMTCRDIQAMEMANSLPWTRSKAFDNSSPVGRFINISSMGKDIQNLDFCLYKNNEIVQKTNTSDMIFSINSIISYISSYITLKVGDLIFTGTPQGVGEVRIGDRLEAILENQSLLKCNIK